MGTQVIAQITRLKQIITPLETLCTRDSKNSESDQSGCEWFTLQVTRMRKLQMLKISCPHFSLPEVGAFGCLPVAVLCLVIALFSAFYPYWVESTLVQSSNSTDGLPLARVDNIFIGLFAFANIPGGKTRNRGAAC